MQDPSNKDLVRLDGHTFITFNRVTQVLTVVSFARFILQLLAVGATPALVHRRLRNSASTVPAERDT